ncbi:hypothetical protein CFK37_13095 [Virgibacillus phasianinus]|uniref:DUF945 domain-containing protein n=1 Tax=Virgibacillus phasianinus TaxID=2017483 RepID=A0A220U5L7_9BACI|nr:DUF6583 family protein [Virgibacillus phasianinus]ASK63013.1 hypothetical protein CFK37_13095 [Virgibacillus phasianinus]
MDGSSNNRKRGTSKKFIIFIITALLIIGGSVSAFVLLNISDKQKYFLAEKTSFEVIGDQFEKRFEPELNWQENVQDNPVDTTLELSATYNDPNANLTTFGPAQIINNSTLTIHNAMDTKEKRMATEVSGAFGGITIDGLNFYLTSNKLLVELPFLKELLQVKDADVGKLLHEVDPTVYTGKEKVDFETFFNGSEVLSKDDQKYLQKEYLETIYDNLPDDAFKAADDSIKVNEKSIDAEKLTFHLSEKQVKDILSSTMKRMKDDKRLKEIIKEQLAIQTLGAGVSTSNLTPGLQNDLDDMMEEFDTTLENAIKQLESFQIPDGMTSTIWVRDDLIVKRDFSLTMGPSEDELLTFTINGTQILGESNQTFDYTLGFIEGAKDSATAENELTVTGDLSWKNNKADDSIKLAAGDGEFTYEGTSTLKDGKRDFERIFALKTGTDEGQLTWSGNAAYNEDKMNSENTLSLQLPGMPEDVFSLQVAKDAKLIKKVEIPQDQDVKDIGSMKVNEIMQYFQNEVTPQFQKWAFKIMGTSGNLNGF